MRFKFLKIGAASYFLMYCIFFGLQPGCIDRILVVICNGNIAFFNATQYEKKKRSCDDLLLTPLSLAYSAIYLLSGVSHIAQHLQFLSLITDDRHLACLNYTVAN